MYELLTPSELTALQDILFSATENAYRLANLAPKDLDWQTHYRPVHAEVAWLFLEVGQELVSRLGSIPGSPHELTCSSRRT